MRRTPLKSTLLLAAIAAAILATPAGATIPEGNLVQNPGAEGGTGVADETSHSCPAAWTCSTGNPTAVTYGAGVFPTLAESERIGGGANFFAGGPNNPDATIIEQIDLSAAAPEIDAGGVQATISGCLGGFDGQDDTTNVGLFEHDSAGGTTFSKTIRGPDAADRGGQTELLPVSFTAPVPALTRFANVQVNFIRNPAGTGTYNDGYADNISLTLGPNPGSAPLAEPCIAPPPAEPDAVPPPMGPAAAPARRKCKKGKRKHRAAESKRHRKCRKHKRTR